MVVGEDGEAFAGAELGALFDVFVGYAFGDEDQFGVGAADGVVRVHRGHSERTGLFHVYIHSYCQTAIETHPSVLNQGLEYFVAVCGRL